MDNQTIAALNAAYTPGRHKSIWGWLSAANLSDAIGQEVLTALAGRIEAAAAANHIRNLAKYTQDGATWGGYHRLASQNTVPTWEAAVAAWKASGNSPAEAESRTRFMFGLMVDCCLTDDDVFAFLDDQRAAAALWEPNPEAAERRIKGLAKIFGKEIAHA